MRNVNIRGLLFIGVFAAAVAVVSVAAAGYRVVKRIPVAGDTGWDYITADTDGRRLYVPHGIEVVVLDLDTGATVGKITGQKGLHGVAVSRDVGRGFISATDPGSVTIFDLKTLAVIEKVRIGDDPNGIIYDPKTKRVFSADRGSKRVTAIDATTGKIFVSTGGGDGVLSIFHQDGADKYSLVENVKTLPGARTMALDHKTGMVYLPVADVGQAPAPTAENPRPRPRTVPGSFSVLVVGQ
jgi:DNA-binding beta-propeller fold protein YncE